MNERQFFYHGTTVTCFEICGKWTAKFCFPGEDDPVFLSGHADYDDARRHARAQLDRSAGFESEELVLNPPA